MAHALTTALFAAAGLVALGVIVFTVRAHWPRIAEVMDAWADGPVCPDCGLSHGPDEACDRGAW